MAGPSQGNAFLRNAVASNRVARVDRCREPKREQHRKTGVIYILPLGMVSLGLCGEIAEGLSEYFPLSVRVLDQGDEPRYAYDPSRGQYYCAAILERLAMTVRDIPPGDGKIIGITNGDICTPVLSFIFGAAQLSGAAALFSLFRLRPEVHGFGVDNKLFFERALKEATHELAHAFGLTHCKRPACIMHLAYSIRDLDQRGLGFCASCWDNLMTKVGEWKK
jgi:archaemetzincin